MIFDHRIGYQIFFIGQLGGIYGNYVVGWAWDYCIHAGFVSRMSAISFLGKKEKRNLIKAWLLFSAVIIQLLIILLTRYLLVDFFG